MTLKEVYSIYPNENDCTDFLDKIRWGQIPICPYCKSTKISNLKEEKRFHCNKCNRSFSVTVGTIFHKTKCDLRKWFLAIHLYETLSIPITARALGEVIDTTKDTAWLMLDKIKKAKQIMPKLLAAISLSIKEKALVCRSIQNHLKIN